MHDRGVLPEGFQSPAMWPRMPEVWVPIGLDPNVTRRDARMLRVLGRVRPVVSLSAHAPISMRFRGRLPPSIRRRRSAPGW